MLGDPSGRWGWKTDVHGNHIAAPVFGRFLHSGTHSAGM